MIQVLRTIKPLMHNCVTHVFNGSFPPHKKKKECTLIKTLITRSKVQYRMNVQRAYTEGLLFGEPAV